LNKLVVEDKIGEEDGVGEGEEEGVLVLVLVLILDGIILYYIGNQRYKDTYLIKWIL
jgi:hypothetical protein